MKKIERDQKIIDNNWMSILNISKRLKNNKNKLKSINMINLNFKNLLKLKIINLSLINLSRLKLCRIMTSQILMSKYFKNIYN